MTAPAHPDSSASLQRFRLVETRSLEEARAIHSALNSPIEAEQTDRRRSFTWQANRVVLGGLGLVESRYGAGVRGSTRNVDRQYSLIVPRRRAGRATQHGVTAAVDPGRAAALFSPGMPATYEFASDYRGSQVSVPGDVMEAALDALIGPDRSRALRFDLSVDLSAGGGADCLRLIEFMLAEVDRDASVLRAPLVAARLAEALVCSLLLGLPHSHSKLVHATPPRAGAGYVLRAEEYLAAHAYAHVSVADLAAAAGIGVRTLHAAFLAHRGCSPQAFVRARRLELARARLLSGTASSVTEVALSCGLEHLGRFSAAYARRFGESPRETLRKHRNR